MAFGSTIQDMLIQLEYLGFFNYVLPFLLVFAVIYGILSFTKVFQEQKAVNIIVAIILGLLSIRLSFFSDFLTELSPRLGVGLVIILTLLILIGMFVPANYEDIISWVLLAIGGVIFVVILLQSSSVLGYFGYDLYSGETVGWIVMIGILVAIVIAVAVSGGHDEFSKTHKRRSGGPRSLFGGHNTEYLGPGGKDQPYTVIPHKQ